MKQGKINKLQKKVTTLYFHKGINTWVCITLSSEMAEEGSIKLPQCYVFASYDEVQRHQLSILTIKFTL